MKLPNYRPEARYGMPAADQIIINRHYIIGYSYYFRQAKWALEIVNPDNPEVKRNEKFRPDYRIPQMFRADLEDYELSGYDRGHLVASANKEGSLIQNSETFLLSNMAPQKAGFNRGIWKTLEEEIRKLNERPEILETYVICGPVFNFNEDIKTIGDKTKNKVTIPVPHSFFKSVLTEDKSGKLRMYSFMIPNKETEPGKELKDYQVPTVMAERYAGIKLWENLVGEETEKEKNRVRML
jgi:endonuclease G